MLVCGDIARALSREQVAAGIFMSFGERGSAVPKGISTFVKRAGSLRGRAPCPSLVSPYCGDLARVLSCVRDIRWLGMCVSHIRVSFFVDLYAGFSYIFGFLRYFWVFALLC